MKTGEGMSETLKLDMSVDEALAFAEEWTRGMTLHAGSQGWRVVCLLLGEEVKALREELAEETYIRERLAGILAETAIALKGPEAALRGHSWHDIGELAGVLKAEVEVLKQQRAALESQLAELQAKYDALMLEFCPDEMTADQLQEWGRNQVPESQRAELREENERLSRDRDMFEQSVAHWKKAYHDDTETLRERIAELEANAMQHAANVIGFCQKIEALESQLAELRQGGEAVAWQYKDTGAIVLDGAIEECRKQSDTWRPLFTRPQPAIPPGYAVVPINPGDSMRYAGAEALENTTYETDFAKVLDVWDAMLASAPAIQPQAAASVPVAEQDWLPIETAPRDGTEIIALDAYSYRNDPKRRMHFVLRSVFFNDEGGWEISEDGEILDEDALTHWLPRSALPASPVAFATPADSKEGEK